ncbi:hypothetical protein JYK22_21300, partial [Nonomuraea sp. RK-328]|nr:hypothetical protein [Nonomuraea sp. RK-328]
MGFFDAVDKLASLGAGSRMSSEQLDAYKNRSQRLNALGDLAMAANGGSGTKAAQRKADAELLKACGGDKAEAKRLKKDAQERAHRAFFG